MSDSTLVAAIVATIVSLIVAVSGFIINYITIYQSQKQFEQQLQRKLTEKLYDKRLEVYPLVFSITDDLRGARLFNELDLQELLKVRNNLLEWNRKQGFVLSDKSIKAFYYLRNALSLDYKNSKEIKKGDLEKIFKAKNEFRSMLRDDVNLLYVEERYE